MPELPEVETVCRGLQKVMAGKVLGEIVLKRKDLRGPFPPRLRRLRHVKILCLERRAKYILAHLQNGETLILHLGMSGRLLINPPKAEKHDHVIFIMKGGLRVVFNDPRRFGLLDLAPTEDLSRHKLFRHLGPEPLMPDFSHRYLTQKLAGKKTAVKLAIMDQRLVVGVGNIYASEALFDAKIDPRRAAGSLTSAETSRLVASIQKVLKQAIAAGGSSLRDYMRVDGELGYFQHQWSVYDKNGRACSGCICDIRKTGGIAQIAQGGRSTFYCPVRQK